MSEDTTVPEVDTSDLGPMGDVVAGGADEEIDKIYRTYVPVLRMIAHRKGMPLNDADDRIHDIFASFILHRATVREPGRYLIGAIRRSTCEYWRAQHVERTRISDVDTSSAADETFFDDAIMARASVCATLSALGPSCRDALRRYYLEGETAAEIAALRQTSVGYIHRLLNLCRRRALAFYQSLSRVV